MKWMLEEILFMFKHGMKHTVISTFADHEVQRKDGEVIKHSVVWIKGFTKRCYVRKTMEWEHQRIRLPMISHD